jgi:hypothetical protein
MVAVRRLRPSSCDQVHALSTTEYFFSDQATIKRGELARMSGSERQPDEWCQSLENRALGRI